MIARSIFWENKYFSSKICCTCEKHPRNHVRQKTRRYARMAHRNEIGSPQVSTIFFLTRKKKSIKYLIKIYLSGFDFFPAECTISSILCVQRRLFGFLLITLFALRFYFTHTTRRACDSWNHFVTKPYYKETSFKGEMRSSQKKQLITLYV